MIVHVSFEILMCLYSIVNVNEVQVECNLHLPVVYVIFSHGNTMQHLIYFLADSFFSSAGQANSI